MTQHRIYNARTGRLLAESWQVDAWRAANPTYRVAYIKAPPGLLAFYVGIPPTAAPATDRRQRH